MRAGAPPVRWGLTGTTEKSMKVHVRAHERTVAELGARNDGVVTWAAAKAAGLPGHALRSLRRHGVLMRVGDEVDRLRDHPPTWRSRLRAAIEVAGPKAAAGLRSGA